MSRAVTLDRRLPRYVAGVLVLVVAAAALLLPARAVVDPLRATLFSPAFPLVLVGLYLLRPFVGVPIGVLSALVGYRYGVLVGVPLAVALGVLTTLPAYAAGRHFLLDGDLFARFTAGSDRFFAATGDFRGLVAARLVPGPTDAVSAGAGAAGLSLPVFVAGTILGGLPWTVGGAYAGATMTRFVPDVTPNVLVPAVAVAVGLLLLARPAYRALGRWRSERST